MNLNNPYIDKIIKERRPDKYILGEKQTIVMVNPIASVVIDWFIVA